MAVFQKFIAMPAPSKTFDDITKCWQIDESATFLFHFITREKFARRTECLVATYRENGNTVRFSNIISNYLQ